MLSAYKGATVVKDEGNYIYCEFEREFGFVDDVEFLFAPDGQASTPRAHTLHRIAVSKLNSSRAEQLALHGRRITRASGTARRRFAHESEPAPQIPRRACA